MKYKLLDLFCGGGGCSKGYVDAGLEVVGVDIEEKNYPYEFIRADVMEILEDENFIKNFDAIHASPPCQCYSRLKYLSGDVERWESTHVDLVEPVRNKLIYYKEKYKIPYVIENVVGAPLINPIKLCGTQFNNMLTQRPRLFESSISLREPNVKPSNIGTSKLGTISETGAVSICGNRKLQGLNEEQTRLYYCIALGGDCSWMTLKELTQCIPPQYTEFIGKQIIEYIDSQHNNKANETVLNIEGFDMDAFIKLVIQHI